jgi:hypothetical protein
MDAKELMALSEKATPGEWRFNVGVEAYGTVSADALALRIALICGPQNANDNGAFIAAAVNFIRSPEFAEMVKNDARYRWLRHGDNDQLVMRIYDEEGKATRNLDLKTDECWMLGRDQLDAAIDAHLAGQGEGNG